MAVNRIVYAVALAGAAVFYLFNGAWFSSLVLLVVLALPVLSLLCSLPAMCTLRMQASGPDTVERGQKAVIHMRAVANRFFPVPDVRVRMTIQTCATGAKEVKYLSRIPQKDGVLSFPADNCGLLRLSLYKGRVYDYLGLFCLRLRLPAPMEIAVLPKAEAPEPLPDLSQFRAVRLQAKKGGGFSEFHENREYRPGDSVRDIHWKLSGKTDKLIVREAMEPVQRRLVLAVETPATLQAMNSALGQLRWLSQWLAERGYSHRVCWRDPDSGDVRFAQVTAEEQVQAMLRQVCGLRVSADARSLPDDLTLGADWLYRITPAGKEAGQ